MSLCVPPSSTSTESLSQLPGIFTRATPLSWPESKTSAIAGAYGFEHLNLNVKEPETGWPSSSRSLIVLSEDACDARSRRIFYAAGSEAMIMVFDEER